MFLNFRSIRRLGNQIISCRRDSFNGRNASQLYRFTLDATRSFASHTAETSTTSTPPNISPSAMGLSDNLFIKEQLKIVGVKANAVAYCIIHHGAIPAFDDSHDETLAGYVKVYRSFSLELLQQQDIALQAEKTALQAEKTLLQAEKTALLQQEAALLQIQATRYILKNSVEDITEWLNSKGFIPPLNITLKPKPLTTSTPELMNRETSKVMFQEAIETRLVYRASRDKDRHPHVIAMSAPGTGKSLLADLGLSILQESEVKDDLRALANNCPIDLRISLNGTTAFKKDVDVPRGGETAVACRMLASYFNFDLDSLNPSSVYINNLSIKVCIDVILADHRRRNQGTLGPSDDVLVYLAIDDVSTIVEVIVDPENAKQCLKQILDGLAACYSQSREDGYFLASIVTGTVYDVTKGILRGSQRPFKNLATPLLSQDQSIALFAASTNIAITSVTPSMKLLLSDIAGIPRFVWQAIDGFKMFKGNDLMVSYHNLREDIKSAMVVRYSSQKKMPKMLKDVIIPAILRQPLDRNKELTNSSRTLKDLENEGRLFLQDCGGSDVIIVLPLLYLEAIVKTSDELNDSTVLMRLIHDLVTMPLATWRGWESFCMSYHALLISLHSQTGKQTITLAELYSGAYVGAGVKDIKILLPPVSYYSPATSVQLDKRFPEMEGSSIEHFDGRQVYVNAAGAPFADGIVPFMLAAPLPPRAKTGTATAEPTTLGCSIHCRYTAGGGVNFNLTNSLLEKQKGYVELSETLAARGATAPFSKNVSVFMSNRRMTNPTVRVKKGDAPGNGGINMKIQEAVFDSEDGIGRNAVVVTKDQMHSFCPRTFADRVSLITEVAPKKSRKKNTKKDMKMDTKNNTK